MSPKELLNQVDESWPIEARFVIQRAAKEWDKQLRIKERQQNRLIYFVIFFCQFYKMSFYMRFKHRKNHIKTLKSAESYANGVKKGFLFYSAENETDETQEQITETNEKSSER